MGNPLAENPLAEDGAYERYISCARKVPYRSKKGAHDAATRIGRRKGVALGNYRCKHCGSYHLFTKRER